MTCNRQRLTRIITFRLPSSGGTLGDWDTSDDIVEVNLGAFDEGDRSDFALSKMSSPNPLISALSTSRYTPLEKMVRSLELVVGEEPPDGAYTNAGADLSNCCSDGFTPPTALMTAVATAYAVRITTVSSGLQ